MTWLNRRNNNKIPPSFTVFISCFRSVTSLSGLKSFPHKENPPVFVPSFFLAATTAVCLPVSAALISRAAVSPHGCFLDSLPPRAVLKCRFAATASCFSPGFNGPLVSCGIPRLSENVLELAEAGKRLEWSSYSCVTGIARSSKIHV